MQYVFGKIAPAEDLAATKTLQEGLTFRRKACIVKYIDQ